MHLDIRRLERYTPSDGRLSGQAAVEPGRPPADLDIFVLGVGNSGESAALRSQALGYTDGTFFMAAGLNNDRLAPRPVTVRRTDGTNGPLELTERLVLDGENPRERIRDFPLLERRYEYLLRGIPVFETYPRAGAGGHGHPVVSALDIDLQIDAVLALLRRSLRQLHETPAQAPGQSDLQRLVSRSRQRVEGMREKRIVVIGGGCGAMGNAGHHLLPYLIRHVLAEQGIAAYELWGVVLGPCAFTKLTPFVRPNYYALIESIEHMSRHGQQRAYINDLEIAIQQPPYDRVFLLDDPTLPREGTRVTEAEIESFLDQAALNLYLLLRGTIWQTVASHTANDDGVARADGRLCYLHTARSAMIGVDRAHLVDALSVELSARVLDQFIQRFDR